MNCCERCFKDAEIKAIICENNSIGTCDFCNEHNVHICTIENNEYLKNIFESLIDVYTPINDIPTNFPKDNADLLKNIMHYKWNIFNLSPNNIYKFLTKLLPEKYDEQPTLFDHPVGIAESIDTEYMLQHSILGTYQWEDFVTEIKEKNRFHTNIINKDIFESLLRATYKSYPAGKTFYRARISENKHKFASKDMGAPPALKACGGRANPQGISCLYMADSIDTTLHEIRAGAYDYATVAEFTLIKDATVVNLTAIDKISPFQNIDSTLLAINLPHLKKIGYEISKPMRRYDSSLDYLPTQYISDYIKSIGIDGIEYKSTLCKNGINFAFFNEDYFKCINTNLYDIDSLTYNYSIIE